MWKKYKGGPTKIRTTPFFSFQIVQWEGTTWIQFKKRIHHHVRASKPWRLNLVCTDRFTISACFSFQFVLKILKFHVSMWLEYSQKCKQFHSMRCICVFVGLLVRGIGKGLKISHYFQYMKILWISKKVSHFISWNV